MSNFWDMKKNEKTNCRFPQGFVSIEYTLITLIWNASSKIHQSPDKLGNMDQIWADLRLTFKNKTYILDKRQFEGVYKALQSCSTKYF